MFKISKIQNLKLATCLQNSKQIFLLSSLTCQISLNKLKINQGSPGLEVIKLEFILILKIKCIDWLLVDTCPQAASTSVHKQPISALYFEFETVLKFYNLKTRAYLAFAPLTHFLQFKRRKNNVQVFFIHPQGKHMDLSSVFHLII